jgi:tyrosyl-tRNA synthetase
MSKTDSKMTLSEELQWRGQIKDKTFEPVNWLDTPRVFYLGADVGSSDSLQVGNLAVYMLARRLVKAGWKPIMLVGGATSLIGDPGGKTEERPLVSKETVEHNKKSIAAQVKRLFGDIDFTLVDNYDWFKDVGYLQFLRDVGKHYSLTELIQRDFIASRIGENSSGISYAEFSYSLIQGYDYWHLFKHHNVVLQIGGSDQWGNMLSGVPLIRKKEGAEVHALSMPLVINKSTGKKFGKSEDGAVWLDADKTSVYRFYQFWLNVDDEGVEDYLKIYSELNKIELDTLIKSFSADKASRSAQKVLAKEVTRIVHGSERAESAERVTAVLFGRADFKDLTAADIDLLKDELTVVQAQETMAQTVVKAGLASSNSEANRFIAAGALTLNGEKVTPEHTGVSKGTHLLKRGKNNFAIIEHA